MNDVAAFVLAGGKSSRMGRDKAALMLGGITLLERAVTIARFASARVSLIGTSEWLNAEASRLGCAAIADIFPEQGPLAGIHAALESQCVGELNFVIAVDTPFVAADFVKFLVGKAAASAALVTAPQTKARLHPLCGIYRRNFAPYARAALVARHNKVESAIPPAGREIVCEQEFRANGFDPAMLANLNTPEDFATAEARLGK